MGALLGAGVVILGLAGCADKNNNGQAETPVTGDAGNAVADNLGDTANAASNGVGKVVNGVANAGKAVENGAANVGKTVANGAANAGKTLDAATLTPQIKTAFGGNKSLNGSNINVDTVGKTVTLSGTVKSAAQKTLAGTLAKQKATGFTIANNLKVGK